ncbi:MAG: hypothetical protein NC548_46580, partial [Lachnospiraceae bacterium]|nr:hypothetical protein [Lachnospiraceae bacterium]
MVTQAIYKLQYLHPSALENLINKIMAEREKLSVRAKNCSPRLTDIKEILPLLYPEPTFNRKRVQHCGKKAEQEILQFLRMAKLIFEEYTNDIDIS